GRLLSAALASGKPLAIVCHAPAAMLATQRKVGSATHESEGRVAQCDRLVGSNREARLRGVWGDPSGFESRAAHRNHNSGRWEWIWQRLRADYGRVTRTTYKSVSHPWPSSLSWQRARGADVPPDPDAENVMGRSVQDPRQRSYRLVRMGHWSDHHGADLP